MLRLLRFCLTTFCATALFAGCCANNTCDCQDRRADALYFQFLTDDSGTNPQAFLPSELDTVWVLRYALPLDTSARPPRDSVSFVLPASQAAGPLVLDNNAPFRLATNRKVNSYEYEIRLRDRNRRLQRFRIDNIKLQGGFEGNGCCTCYENSGKVARVNGQTYNVTETNRQPVIIPLTR